MHDEDHGCRLANQDVGIQYSGIMLDSVIDRNEFKVLTNEYLFGLYIIYFLIYLNPGKSLGLEHLVKNGWTVIFVMMGWKIISLSNC